MRKITFRAVTLTTMSILVLLVSGSVAWGQDASSFRYGTDRAAWFWQTPLSESPVPGVAVPPPPAPLPNPQSSNTLPVSVQNGAPEKASAIFIDLFSRGVARGSTIIRLSLSIDEGSDPGEAPPFNESAATIQACPIEWSWASGQAELWSNHPAFQQDACAAGVRNTSTTPAKWTFDLTSLAEAWGHDPSANHGVMLVGTTDGQPTSSTWQVDLKLPKKDDPTTAANEYQQTKNSVSIALSFDLPTGSHLGTVGRTESPPLFMPSVPVAAAPITQAAPGPVAPPTVAVAPPLVFSPVRFPSAVWALVPTGLILIGLIGWVVFEVDPALSGEVLARLFHGQPLLGMKALKQIETNRLAASNARNGERPRRKEKESLPENKLSGGYLAE